MKEVTVTHDNPPQLQVPQILERDWGQEVIFADTPHYLGKLLYMRKDSPGGLQFHVEKDETFYLYEGSASVEWEQEVELGVWRLEPGDAVRVPPGAIHRVIPHTDCLFIEASTPHHDDRVHVEAEHGQDETGGLPSTWESEDGVRYRRVRGS